MTIAIIGTGLAGMVQALALAANNMPVTLIGPDAKPDKRSTAIMTPGIDFLKLLDAWEAIKPSATSLATMELVDGKSNFYFDASEIDQLTFGYNIDNTALKKRLHELVSKNKLITWHKHNAVAFEKKSIGWNITLADKKKISCDLLIGADGRNSPSRDAAGIEITTKDIDQAALVGLVQPEKSHFNTTVEWYRKGGPLTMVPTKDNCFAMVWCDTTKTQQQKQQYSKSELENELTELTGKRFGKLKLKNDLQLWPIRPIKSDSLIATDYALIGEAAHVLPPIGAQGFNTSLYDIMALTNTLKDAVEIGYRVNDPSILRLYEHSRLSDMNLRSKTANSLNTTLLSGNPVLHRLRRFSLNGIGHFAVIKKFVMQTGQGLQQGTR